MKVRKHLGEWSPLNHQAISSSRNQRYEDGASPPHLLVHWVDESADAVVGNGDFIAGLESKVVAGDDGCAGHEQGSGGEGVVAVEEVRELLHAAFELGDGRLAG